jgi:hypothetical protein
MIRALIGRFVQGCIDAHKRRQFLGKWSKVDFTKMTDAEVSAFVHGRPIDWAAVDAREPVQQPKRRVPLL